MEWYVVVILALISMMVGMVLTLRFKHHTIINNYAPTASATASATSPAAPASSRGSWAWLLLIGVVAFLLVSQFLSVGQPQAVSVPEQVPESIPIQATVAVATAVTVTVVPSTAVPTVLPVIQYPYETPTWVRIVAAISVTALLTLMVMAVTVGLLLWRRRVTIPQTPQLNVPPYSPWHMPLVTPEPQRQAALEYAEKVLEKAGDDW